MCSENTVEGESGCIRDGLRRVGNSKKNHLGAQSLTEERLMNPVNSRVIDNKCHKRGIKFYKGSEDTKGTSNQNDLRKVFEKAEI